MNKELKVVITAEDRASGTLRNLESNLKGTSDSFGSTTIATEGFGSAITRANVLAGLAVQGLTALARGILDVGKAALESAADFEQFRISFDVILGSKEKGAKMMKDLAIFAEETPFELDQVTEMTKRLLAFGFAGEEVIPIMKRFGDMAAVTGKDKLPQLVRAFGQARNSGKLMLEEVNQFTDAGVPLLQALTDEYNKNGGALKKVGGASKQLTREAASLNKKLDDQRFKLQYMKKNGDEGEKSYKRLEEQIKFTKAQIKDLGPISEGSMQRVKVSVADMREMISDGEVSFEDLNKAIERLTNEGGIYFGQGEAQAKSFNGVMSNVVDRLKRVGRAALGMDTEGNVREGSIFAIIKTSAEQLYVFLKDNETNITGTFDAIGQQFAKLGEYISGPALWFWQKYGDEITYILQKLYVIIEAIVKAIVWVWQNDFLYLRSIIMWVLTSLGKMFEGAFAFILNLVKFFAAAFTGDWNGMLEAGKGMLEGFLKFVNGLFNQIPGLIWDALKKGYENLTKWFGDMWGYVTKWSDDMRQKIKDAFDWNKKKSPSYNDLMSETERESKKKLNVILDNGYMSRFGGNQMQSTAPTSSNVNINFNGNMSVRSDKDINDIAMQVKRIINREDVLFSQGLY